VTEDAENPTPTGEEAPVFDRVAAGKKEQARARERKNRIRVRARYWEKKAELSQKAKGIEITEETARDIINRGIIPFEPTEEQITFTMNYLTAQERPASRQRAEFARNFGFDPAVVTGWFRSIRFRLWFEEVRRQCFAHYKPQVDKVLIEQALLGKYKFVELFYTMTGDLQKAVVESSAEMEQLEGLDVHQRFLLFQKKISLTRGTMGDQPVPSITEVAKSMDVTPVERTRVERVDKPEPEEFDVPEGVDE